MLVVLPIFENTQGLREKAAVIRQYGPVGAYDLWVVPVASRTQDAQEFVSQVKGFFRDAVLVPDFVPKINSNAIGIRNQLFKDVAVRARQANIPFLWMEDATPVATDWVRTIDLEYRDAGQPYLGCIVDTYLHGPPQESDKPGGKSKPTFVKQGEHMRFGVWSPLVGESNLFNYMAKPFEVELQLEMKKAKWARSHTMATIYASTHFKLSTTQITGQKSDESAIRKVVPILVSPRLVMVHGCRDGSLEAALLKAKG